ncbi:MAG TPA: WYL domain-containing protein, partial [Herpetosiphonaceae bacterium]
MELTPPDASRLLPDQVQLRVDRIVAATLKLLPRPLPPQRLGIRTWAIAYWLSPEVAGRRDVNVPFEQPIIEYHDDGSADVRAVTHNLWQAWQTLMRYGDGCLVREPPELVERFRRSVAGMAALYGLAPAEPEP